MAQTGTQVMPYGTRRVLDEPAWYTHVTLIGHVAELKDDEDLADVDRLARVGDGQAALAEPDTVVEPDVAVNPTNGSNAVAAAHDSRFPDGGAVAISAAWTKDAGRHSATAGGPSRTRTVGSSDSWSRCRTTVVAASALHSGSVRSRPSSMPLRRTATSPATTSAPRSRRGGCTWCSRSPPSRRRGRHRPTTR